MEDFWAFLFSTSRKGFVYVDAETVTSNCQSGHTLKPPKRGCSELYVYLVSIAFCHDTA